MSWMHTLGRGNQELKLCQEQSQYLDVWLIVLYNIGEKLDRALRSIIWVSTIHHHRPMNLLSPSLFVFHRAMWPVLEGPWPLLLLLQLLLLQPLCLMTITTTIVATRTILGWVLDASKMAHGSSVSSHFSCALLPTWRLFSSGLRAFHFRPILPAIVVLA